jgi:hypothetical protein
MNRRPYPVVILLCVASLAAGAGGTAAFLGSRKKPASEPRAENIPAPPIAAAAVVVGVADPARLPSDRVLLPSADTSVVGGKVVCGHCEWQVGSVCKKGVLWDAEKRHLVMLLPNEKLSELQEKLTPK